MSKLVAIHDESSPIYEVNISGFFGFAKPSVGSIEFQVAGFVEHVRRIKEQYAAWAADPQFTQITSQLTGEHPILKACHPVRLCDFLVWAVEHYGLK